jgi:ribonuclease HI
VDGGARGNPGPAGYGVRLELPGGVLHDEIWGWLGESTNNVAEYRALLEAVHRAVDGGFRELVVRTDSELVARQLSGEYRVRQSHLKVLHREVVEAAKALDRFEVRHVRRERNRHADALANLAMDRRDSGSTGGGERPASRRDTR